MISGIDGNSSFLHEVAMRQKPDPIIIPLQSRMFAEGIGVTELCKAAKVSPSTWSRWARGGVPDLAVLRRLEGALDEMIEAAQA